MKILQKAVQKSEETRRIAEKELNQDKIRIISEKEELQKLYQKLKNDKQIVEDQCHLLEGNLKQNNELIIHLQAEIELMV